MTDKSHPNQAAEAFRAVISPHRSLSPRGFAVLIGVICAVNFAVGLVFWLIGAWPILLFCGLDVLLIYWAFKANYRAGLAYETIDLTPAQLTVTSVAASGEKRTWEFNPYWVRVALDEHHDGRAELALVHHGRRLVFGRCLTADEKREFATALRAALVKARAAVGF